MGRNSNLTVPQGLSNQDRRFAEGIKENLDVILGHRGDPLQRAVTFQDLLDANIIEFARGINLFSSTSDIAPVVNNIPNLDIPPAPTNLQASGAFQNIILTWDLALYQGHSAVQVWRHTSDVISSATMVAQVSGFTGVYADSVGEGQTFYYWVRAINQNDVTGPFNSSTGTLGQTAPDIDFLLTTLANSITSSQLAQDLSTPIGNLPADTTAAITAVQASVDAVKTGFEDWDSTKAYQLNDVVKESTSSTKLYLCVLAVSANSGIALTNTSYWKLYGDYDLLKSSTDAASTAITQLNTISSNSTSALARSVNALDASVFNSDGTQKLASASAFSALETAVNHTDTGLAATAFIVNVLEGVLLNNVGNPIVSASNLSTMSTSLLNTDGTARADANQINQLAVSFTNPTTGAANALTLQEALEASASEVDGLRGQYSVKIDNNGHVSGFGFNSTAVDGTPRSAFIVRADTFAIVDPTSTGNGLGTTTPSPDSVPFIYHDGTGTLNGENVPAGVYIKALFVADASITNAKIKDLAADKIDSGFINSDRIETGSLDASKLNIDGSSITSTILNGVPTLQIGDVNVNNLTGNEINATIMSGTTVYANRLTGDVNKLLPFRSTTPVQFKGNAASGGGTVVVTTQQLPATTHLTVGHKPFASVTGWYDSTNNKTYSFKLYMQIGSGSYTLVGETRFKANTNLYAQFAVSGSLSTPTTSVVNLKLEVTRTGSSGIFDSDTSTTVDNIYEVSGFILGAR